MDLPGFGWDALAAPSFTHLRGAAFSLPTGSTEITVGVVVYIGWLSPNRACSAVLFIRRKATRCNHRQGTDEPGKIKLLAVAEKQLAI